MIRFLMRSSFTTAAVLIAGALIGAAHGQSKKNVLLICVDDLRPELKSFGVDYIHSPNIDDLAARGRAFHRHYVQSPTCGASRFAMLTGQYGPPGNQALLDRSKSIDHPSFPAWFRERGYTTVSVGKVSHHPGGRGGPDWDDESVPEMPHSWDRHLLPCGDWKHPRGAMHGLAHGEIRKNRSEMDLFQSVDVPDTAYPDGLIVKEALKQLTLLTADSKDNSNSSTAKPFFLAVGIIRPHLPFGAPAKYMEHYREAQFPAIAHPNKPAAENGKTTWHKSGEFMGYHRWNRDPNTDAEFAFEVRKHYAACISYADALVGKIMRQVDDLGLRDDTIIVLWGDHGWHLGEHAIWGKHALFEESLRSPLIISHSGMANPGVPADSVVESIDLFPTICELARLEPPDFVHGRSLVPILRDPAEMGRPAVSYHRRASTIRTERYRLVSHDSPESHVELYDHSTPQGEARNLASEQPEVVARLNEILQSRLDLREK